MGISEMIKENGLLNLGSKLVVKLVTDVGSTKKCCLAITYKNESYFIANSTQNDWTLVYPTYHRDVLGNIKMVS